MPIVERLPLSELAALPRRLSFFKSAPRIPAAALAKGLCPPLLVSGASLVWGGCLLDAALGLGAARSVALPVERLELSPQEELLAALAREGRCGAYAPEEGFAIARAAIARAALAIGSDPDFLEEVSILVLGSGGLFALLPRLDALPEGRRALVETGLVDLKTAERARSLPEEAAAAFPSLAASLSASGRRLALGWLDDICLHEGISGPAAAGLVAEAASAPDPLAALRERRYPELSAMEANFARIAKESLGGSGLKLEAPPNFEGSGFTLSLQFSSGAELARRLASASRLTERADELFSLLR
jgi:hypothetical protein